MITNESPEFDEKNIPLISGMSIIDLMKAVAFRNNSAQPLFEKVLPILLFLPDTEEWMKRFEDCLIHFTEQNIYAHCVAGVHSRKFGIQGTRKYMRDAYSRIQHKYKDGLPDVMPEELKEQSYQGDGRTGGYLSHYMLYNIMSAMNYEYYMLMECDCRFVEGWEKKLEQALKDVPEDFDFLFVGSSDAKNKEPEHIKGDVYKFPKRKGKEGWYPMCGHCYIVAKRALPIIIATQRDTADSVDVSLIYESFPYLNVYGILPRLADQHNMYLPE